MTTPQEAATSTIVAPQVLLGDHLKALKLPTFAREFEKVAMESAQDRADYPRYLLRLCELERIDRDRRAIERRIRLARFPQVKSLDTFDFAAQPSLNKQLVLELAPCEWIEKRHNGIALGPSGTGKTHIALALGLAACQKGVIVEFSRNPTLRTLRSGAGSLSQPVSLGRFGSGLAEQASWNVDQRELSSLLWQFVGVGFHDYLDSFVAGVDFDPHGTVFKIDFVPSARFAADDGMGHVRACGMLKG